MSVSRDGRGPSASPEINPHFMECEGSLPCVQDPVNGPYPDPHEFSSHPIRLLPNHPSVCA
jgi:hypothetical protein